MLGQNIKRPPLAYQAPHPTNHINARLDWYLSFEAAEARRRFLFRDAREEREAASMRRPIPTERAYAWFGLLLGAFPFAAILLRIFSDEFARRILDGEWMELEWGWFFLLLSMNAACALSGKFFGATLGKNIDALERRSWHSMFWGMLLLGFLWGVMTGALSGALAFGIGAFFGAALAVPFGMLAFALFTPLHRLMARGGMIDARHFWPLACGVTLLLAALVLSPNY